MKIEFGRRLKTSIPCKLCGHAFVRVYSYYFDDGLIKVVVGCDNCKMGTVGMSLLNRRYAEYKALNWWRWYNKDRITGDFNFITDMRTDPYFRVKSKKELIKDRLTAALCAVFAVCLLAMSLLETAICRNAAVQDSYFDPATGATIHLVDGDEQ